MLRGHDRCKASTQFVADDFFLLKKKIIFRVWSLVPKQSEGINQSSKINGFPNTSSNNCTFTFWFKAEKCLISQLLLFSSLVEKIGIFRQNRLVKVQLLLDVFGKITCFTHGEQTIVNSCNCSTRLRLVLQTSHSLEIARFPH